MGFSFPSSAETKCKHLRSSHVSFPQPHYFRTEFLPSTRMAERGLLIVNEVTRALRTAAVSDASNWEGVLCLLSPADCVPYISRESVMKYNQACKPETYRKYLHRHSEPSKHGFHVISWFAPMTFTQKHQIFPGFERWWWQGHWLFHPTSLEIEELGILSEQQWILWTDNPLQVGSIPPPFLPPHYFPENNVKPREPKK